MPPIPELGHARDPQRTAVVAHDGALVVDETAAVPGEQAPTACRVDVAPRIDPVTSGTHRRTFGRNCNASSSPSSALASNASAGTHSGNGVTILRWAPDAVCSSSMASSAGEGKRSARRTSTGQMRRWTSVTLPSMRRVATTAGELRRPVDGVEDLVAARMRPPTPPDRLASDELRHVRHRSACRLQQHASPPQQRHERPAVWRTAPVVRHGDPHSASWAWPVMRSSISQ